MRSATCTAAHALDAVLEAIAPAADDLIVLLGDLVDQGHDSCQVLDRVLELSRRCHVVLVRGNHEEMMLAARDSQSALRYWEVCGGIATLNSYRYGAKLCHVPDDHWELLEATRDYLRNRPPHLHARQLPGRRADARASPTINCGGPCWTRPTRGRTSRARP